jgi:hypothetical protein
VLLPRGNCYWKKLTYYQAKHRLSLDCFITTALCSDYCHLANVSVNITVPCIDIQNRNNRQVSIFYIYLCINAQTHTYIFTTVSFCPSNLFMSFRTYATRSFTNRASQNILLTQRSIWAVCVHSES